MSLVWIDCIRRLKEEAQDAAKEEQEKAQKLLEQKKKKKINSSSETSAKTSKIRKVSFNSIVHVNFFELLSLRNEFFNT